MSPSRRRFIATAATTPLAAAATFRTLSADEAKVLDLLCAQIVPTDRDAGAREAGAVNYIDLQLAGPLKRFARYYRQGLANLGATDFASMAFDAQTAFLKRIEAGEMRGAEWRIQSAAAFFNMVIDHTMQAFTAIPNMAATKAR